jgi:hypothetical protein
MKQSTFIFPELNNETLTEMEKLNYFGETARQNFFEYHRQLLQQISIFALPSQRNGNELDFLIDGSSHDYGDESKFRIDQLKLHADGMLLNNSYDHSSQATPIIPPAHTGRRRSFSFDESNLKSKPGQTLADLFGKPISLLSVDSKLPPITQHNKNAHTGMPYRLRCSRRVVDMISFCLERYACDEEKSGRTFSSVGKV